MSTPIRTKSRRFQLNLTSTSTVSESLPSARLTDVDLFPLQLVNTGFQTLIPLALISVHRNPACMSDQEQGLRSEGQRT